MSKVWDLVWRRRGDTYRTIIVAVLIALGVRTFAYEPFNIPSGSMKPTLLVGDYLFVSKFTYGYSRHSFPWSFPPFSGRIPDGEAGRGEVAVFKWPDDNETDFIKRVIGLPGDRVQVKQGRLYINGEVVPREQVTDTEPADMCRDRTGQLKPMTIYRETLPGGSRHLIWECSDEADKDNTKEFVVPPGHYFMMGDNRDNSNDSRGWRNPYAPAENLIGRAEFIFFSHGEGTEIWEVHKWIDAIRWGRLGMGVE